MGRDDERRPSSSRNLYWEVFFSPDGAELAEFVGFFGAGLGVTGFASTFLGLGLGVVAAGVGAEALAGVDVLTLFGLAFGVLGAFFWSLEALFADLVRLFVDLEALVGVAGFCFVLLECR